LKEENKNFQDNKGALEDAILNLISDKKKNIQSTNSLENWNENTKEEAVPNTIEVKHTEEQTNVFNEEIVQTEHKNPKVSEEDVRELANY
jgi:hypothetical protein